MAVLTDTRLWVAANVPAPTPTGLSAPWGRTRSSASPSSSARSRQPAAAQPGRAARSAAHPVGGRIRAA